MRLLVTGFGPFPGIPRNPSAALVRRLARHRGLQRAGISVVPLLIPTEYAAAARLVPEALQKAKPEAILMFGVAGRQRHLSLETRAVNRVSILHPDAAGIRSAGLTLMARGAPVLRARAPVPALQGAAERAGVRTRLSRDAGRYLCNAAYYRMLAETRADQPCLFVHIPKVRGPRAMDRLVRAAAAIACRLVRFRPRAEPRPA